MARVNATTQSGGQVALVVATAMFAVSIAIVGTFASIGLAEGLSARTLHNSKKSFYAAEGALEFVTYKLEHGSTRTFSSGETHSIEGVTATVTSALAGAGTYYTAAATVGNARRGVAYVAPGGIAFDMPYAAYAGLVGIDFKSAQAKITGDVKSYGSIQGVSGNEDNYNGIEGANVILAAHPGANADAYAQNDYSVATGNPSCPAPTQSGASFSCMPWRYQSSTTKVAQSFAVARTGQPRLLRVNAAKYGTPSAFHVKIVGSKLSNGVTVPDATDVYATGSFTAAGTSLAWQDITLSPTSGKFLVANTSPRAYWILFTAGSASTGNYYKLATNAVATSTAMLWNSTETFTNATLSTTNAKLTYQLYIGVAQTKIDKVKINDDYSQGCLVGSVEADLITSANTIQAKSIVYRDLPAPSGAECAGATVTRGTDDNALLKATDAISTPISDAEIAELLAIADVRVCNTQECNYVSGSPSTFRDPATMEARSYPYDASGGFYMPPNVDFIVDGTDQTLNIRGVIHVQGNMEIRGAKGGQANSTGCIMKVGSEFGSKSAIIIVDGTVKINNKCTIQGSGDAAGKSHLIIISRALNTGSDPVIDVYEQATADIIMATRGTIRVRDSAQTVRARAVTAPYIVLDGNAEISIGESNFFELVIPAQSFSYSHWGEIE